MRISKQFSAKGLNVLLELDPAALRFHVTAWTPRARRTWSAPIEDLAPSRGRRELRQVLAPIRRLLHADAKAEGSLP